MPGVYESWDECKKQVQSYPGAKYKAFSSREAAEDAFVSGPDHTKSKKKTKPSVPRSTAPDGTKEDGLTVDAACSGNPGLMEYRGVWLKDGVEEFRKGPFRKGTNNIGEFLAIVHGAALLQSRGDTKTPIYTDSRTALAWIRKKKANTTLKFNASNQRLKKLIERAESWLKKNDIPNPLKKWDTKNWGEIPADFGRK